MKILHTSDWHLGRTLYGRKRYDEFAALLDWLAETIETQQIDVLLVAGDVFDTTTPGNRAQSLYYRFLYRVSVSCCRHVVVIVEIEYTGRDMVAGLREILDEAVADSGMEIRRIKNKPVMDRVFRTIQAQETLDDLDPKEVFDRRLDAEGVTEEDRRQLSSVYQEIVTALLEEDKHAE